LIVYASLWREYQGVGLTLLATALSEAASPAANELGVRSGGDGGTGRCCAIVDSLAELGVSHVEMPTTLERVWRNIRAATAGEL